MQAHSGCTPTLPPTTSELEALATYERIYKDNSRGIPFLKVLKEAPTPEMEVFVSMMSRIGKA